MPFGDLEVYVEGALRIRNASIFGASCVCVCEREIERERESVCVCVCVSVLSLTLLHCPPFSNFFEKKK